MDLLNNDRDAMLLEVLCKSVLARSKPPTNPNGPRCDCANGKTSGAESDASTITLRKLQGDLAAVLLETTELRGEAAAQRVRMDSYEARFAALEAGAASATQLSSPAVAAVNRSDNAAPQSASFQSASALPRGARGTTIALGVPTNRSATQVPAHLLLQIANDHAMAIHMQQDDAEVDKAPFADVPARGPGALVTVLDDGVVVTEASIAAYRKLYDREDAWVPGRQMVHARGIDGDLKPLGSGQLSPLLSRATVACPLIVMQAPTKASGLDGPLSPAIKEAVRTAMSKYKQNRSQKYSPAPAPGSRHVEADNKRGKSSAAPHARGRQSSVGTSARPASQARGQLSGGQPSASGADVKILKKKPVAAAAASAEADGAQPQEDSSDHSDQEAHAQNALKRRPRNARSVHAQPADPVGAHPHDARADTYAAEQSILSLGEIAMAMRAEADADARGIDLYMTKEINTRMRRGATKAEALKDASCPAGILWAASVSNKKACAAEKEAAAAAVVGYTAARACAAGKEKADQRDSDDRGEELGANGGDVDGEGEGRGPVGQGEASQFATPLLDRSPTPSRPSPPHIRAEPLAGAVASPVAVSGSGVFSRQLPPQPADVSDGGPLPPSDSAAAAAKPSAFARKPVVTRSASTGANAAPAGASDNTAEADDTVPARGGGRRGKGAN